jgi:threonine dehydratase
VTVRLDRVAAAAEVIDPVFLRGPQYVDGQLAAVLGRPVLVKVETLNPIGSFKGRGADLLTRDLAPGTRVVCASSGNFGQAMAYAGRRHGVHVHVFLPAEVNPLKLDRMRTLGAEVTIVDGGGAAAAGAAAEHCRRNPGQVHVTGTEPAVIEGAATIGLELLAARPDVVVLPVGGASLITGVAAVLKHEAPATRVIGACPLAAPAVARSWQAGRPVHVPEGATCADGIAGTTPSEAVVARLRVLVDDMVLVSDEEMLYAARLVARTLGVLVEPSAVAGLAALAGLSVAGSAPATVLTGAQPRPELGLTP